MTLPFSLWWLFLAILAILITASSIGSILALKYGSQNPTISNLNARINAWWVMTLVLVLAFITGHVGSTILFFLVSFAALRECLSLIYSRRGDYAVLVACFYVVLPVQYYFVLTDWYGMFAIFIPVYVPPPPAKLSTMISSIIKPPVMNADNSLIYCIKTQYIKIVKFTMKYQLAVFFAHRFRRYPKKQKPRMSGA